jgi:hypothetical protein
MHVLRVLHDSIPRFLLRRLHLTPCHFYTAEQNNRVYNCKSSLCYSSQNPYPKPASDDIISKNAGTDDVIDLKSIITISEFIKYRIGILIFTMSIHAISDKM